METLCRALVQQAVSSHRAQFYAQAYVKVLYWYRIKILSKLSTSLFFFNVRLFLVAILTILLADFPVPSLLFDRLV
jgi:hypothetical protein